MADNYPKLKVVAALIIGSAAFGFAPIFVRFAPETSPIVLISYRTGLAALMLLPFWLVLRSRESRIGGSREHLWVVLSGICLALHFTFWIYSLKYTSVASASVLVTIHPIIMILVERLWFKRRFASTTWAGVVLAFSGSVVLGVSDSQLEQSFSNPLFGNFLALTAAVIFVAYLLIGQQLRKKREWIDYVFPVYTYAAAVCVAMAVVMGDSLFHISSAGFWAGVGMAFGPQILGHGSMNYAVKYVSPTLLSTLILTEPLLASILAFFLFAELPPVASIAAMGMILIGITLTFRKS